MFVGLIKDKTMKNYKMGSVKMMMEKNGFPKGLILKRELTLRECKYILDKLLGIDLLEREDFYDDEEYRDQMNNYKDTVNAWLKGDAADYSIAEFSYDYQFAQLGLMNMIPIVAYLKKKGIIE